jgi:hypothetical protein
MKNILLLVCLSFTIGCVAQQNFDQLDRMDQIQAVVVTPKMFDMMAKVKMDDTDKGAAHYLALIASLDQLKLYTTTDKQAAIIMKSVVDQYVVASKLSVLTAVSEQEKKVSLYTKPGTTTDLVAEILLHLEGTGNQESMLFSLTGNINLDEVAFLSERLKLNGNESIQKAVKSLKK